MAAFDLFGLKKGLPPPEEPSHAAPSARPGLGRKAWMGLAVADGLLVLGCLAFLAVRVKGHMAAPPLPPPAPPRHLAKGAKPPEAKPAEPPKPEAKKAEEPKPEPKAEAKKPEPPKHEAKKPEPPKHEKKPSSKEEAKGPVGSPAVNAEPLPQRKAEPAGAAPKAEPAKAEAPKKAEAPSGKKRLTRPVPFTHEDSKAKEVYLVGPFLVRTGGRKTLFKDSKGVWQTTIYLNIGQTYKYRFEVVSESGSKKLTPAQKVEVLDGD